MNAFSRDKVQQGGEFTADLAISSCIMWPGAWEGNEEKPAFNSVPSSQ